jgi:hypothetical protein
MWENQAPNDPARVWETRVEGTCGWSRQVTRGTTMSVAGCAITTLTQRRCRAKTDPTKHKQTFLDLGQVSALDRRQGQAQHQTALLANAYCLSGGLQLQQMQHVRDGLHQGRTFRRAPAPAASQDAHRGAAVPGPPPARRCARQDLSDEGCVRCRAGTTSVSFIRITRGAS